MTDDKTHIILCGGAPLPAKFRRMPSHRVHKFHCDPSRREHNVNIELPHLIKQVNCHFPDRIKDLLEIAGYIYAADRMTKRGNPSQVEYHSWSREFHFFIKVRDHKFWKKKSIAENLNKLLSFVSGDLSYNFTFVAEGKDVGQVNLFDNENISIDKKENSAIALFSGGLDSLAGALDLLNKPNQNLILISHQSNNFAVTNIQKGIFNLLDKDFPGRLQRFPFTCSLHGERAVEETQRTRIFLYTCIAYSLMSLADEKTIYVFENGMTSINFPKRQDMMNARSSRTTHPQTIFLLEQFFSGISPTPINVKQPFFNLTKTEVFEKIKKFGKLNYLNSTITCTKTFNISKKTSPSFHCGECSQCIDRRFASFSSSVDDYEVIYDTDILKDSMKDDEGYTHMCDFIATAHGFSEMSAVQFPFEMLNDLNDIVPYLPGTINTEKIKKIYELTQRHSNQVLLALQKIRSKEDLFKPKKKNSIYSFIDDRVFLKPQVERLIDRICEKTSAAIPIAFERQKPENENVLNDQLNALLKGEADDYKREFPAIKFSFAKTIPDHSFPEYDLLIEAKLLKKDTSKASITNQLAADIIKYGNAHKLFFLYDPERKIVDETDFKKDFEKHSGCFIHIVR
jgi:DpnII restriction endonuclease/queuosine biosynthesis protein QueC